MKDSTVEKFLSQSQNMRRALSIDKNASLDFEFLGQGEYNANYSFMHPHTREKLVLRLNFGSQMHLDNQIEYEFQALQALELSERTPLPYYVDGSKEIIDYGALVMSFCPGEHLDYDKETLKAAAILADVHSIDPSKVQLVNPPNPLEAMWEECNAMYSKYRGSQFANAEIVSVVDDLFQKLGKIDREKERRRLFEKKIISTELNSTNFLIAREVKIHNGGKDYLVDWEKPILGDVAQDLAHFLAPTTTYWKTDYLFSLQEKQDFLKAYRQFVGERFELGDLESRVNTYLSFNCLRGITWCSMASVEYESSGRELINESTHQKIVEYLTPEFLERIRSEYFSF